MRPGIRALLVALLLFASSARAQTPNSNSVGERSALGSTLDADFVRDLPTSDNLFQLLETTEPSLIADRFLGGGLYAGQSARVGGFLGSWSQTLFRVGDVGLTDPSGSGAPLLFPDLMLWRVVDVATGLMPADMNATGLAITLEPRRPTATWVRTVQATASPFAPSFTGRAPAIARLDAWDRVTVLSSGPIIENRLGVVFAASWTRGSQFDRDDAAPVTSSLGSAFAHLVFTPSDHDEIRTIGWLQRASAPFLHRLPFNQPGSTTTDRAGHAQATWEHRDPNAVPWRVFASYTGRHRAPDVAVSPGAVFERLGDGPVSALASISSGAVYQWSLGTRIGNRATGSTGKRQTLQAGVDAGGGRAEASSFFSGVAGELVDSLPARVWRFANPGVDSIRHEISTAAYLSDRIAVAPNMYLDAALRYDMVSGSADGAVTDVHWGTWLPRAAIHWTVGDAWQPTLFAGYARSAYRLPLDLLAVGDPGAPTADVFRWNAPSGSAASLTALGPLVARAGPGTGGDDGFSRIDPDLKRPLADELVVGMELRPSASLRLRLTGVARSERDLVGLVNVGAPTYAIFGVFDPGGDVLGAEDDRFVPVYNRLPESFGDDRYLLTNPEQSAATFKGIELSVELNTGRLVLLVGGTAGRAEGSAANRGFGPLENDQSLIGELAVDPNAGTFARGRLFSDRAYTAKVRGVYRFPSAITLGFVARYQDGQPFARMLVFPTLNQGAEAVRAFANGDSRFTYTATLDARLQKGFTIGSRRVEAVVDAYNLLNLSNSVEERATQAPDDRTTTAVQPPRALHAGMRVTW